MRTLSEPISLQKIFDAAVTAFLVEDRAFARSARGGCDYVTPSGDRCAVGLCLPIEESDYVVNGHTHRCDFHDSKLDSVISHGFFCLVEAFPQWFDDRIRSYLEARDDEDRLAPVAVRKLNGFQDRLHDLWSRSLDRRRFSELLPDEQVRMLSTYRKVAQDYDLVLPDAFLDFEAAFQARQAPVPPSE